MASIPSHHELYFVYLLCDPHPTRWLVRQRAAAAAAVEAARRARRRRARVARDRFRIRVCAAAQCRGQAARVDGNVSGLLVHNRALKPRLHIGNVYPSFGHWSIADMNFCHDRNTTRICHLNCLASSPLRSASHTSTRRSARYCRTSRAPPPSR